jgi:tetratricopeptide (TPR) repeat protein
LSLGEFRRRLVAAILSQDPPAPEELEEELDTEALQELIGFRYVLLAPLFGVELLELHVGPDGELRVLCRVGEDEEVVPLPTLRQALRERVRAEVDRSSTGSPFSIDLAVIPEVEEAARQGDHDRVVELLGAWPGPLSLLLRTAEGQRLTLEVRGTLARSLGLLGTAYAETGRSEWAGEVLRLGIQWAQDGPIAGDLFQRMGRAAVTGGRHGQAIGLLRRALSLGVDPREVVPHLARSYAAREKYVAAMLCAEESMALGAADAEIEAIMEAGRERLGESWARFRELVPAPTNDSETIPAPPPSEDA